jgi:hypothetical protein
MYKSSLIFNTQPLVVNPELATLIGLNEAIILQQIHYWVKINEKANKNFFEGRYWTYNTIDDWQKQFPFWSYTTVKRTLSNLKKRNLLITGKFNKSNYDQTLWYTINYDELTKIENDIKKLQTDIQKGENNGKTLISSNRSNWPNRSDQTPEPSIRSNWPIRLGQDEPMEQGNMNHPIPENKTKNNTENINQSITKKDRLIERYSLEYIKEMLDTDNFAKSHNGEFYEELTNLVYDVVNETNDQIKINGNFVPTEIVRSRFLKLTPEHINYVIESFISQKQKVHNVRQYLITALYNSFTSMESYYKNAVNSDIHGMLNE